MPRLSHTQMKRLTAERGGGRWIIVSIYIYIKTKSKNIRFLTIETIV